MDVHPGPISEVWRQGKLEELPGIGTGLAGQIAELLETGHSREHDRLAVLVPPGVLEMLLVEGVGPKTAAAAWKGLGITCLDAFEEACRTGRILEAPRMGEKRAAAILEAILRHRARSGRTPLHRAIGWADALVARLSKVPGVARAEAAGSLRRRREMGLKLSEYGVFDRKGRRLGGATEEEIFRAVGLPFIPPELREGAGEIEAAERGKLPRLVEEEDVLGDLHVHSSASSSGLRELAEAARRLGRRYLAVTDHSRSRPLGLDATRLAEQAAAVRALDRDLRGRPHLLAGIEVDILPSGDLDLPVEDLARLDLVVASVHSHFGDSAERMTGRIAKALRSGVVHVLGHPSGREIGKRDAYALDLEEVLEVAREQGVALEVNAMPGRLDLTDRGCRLAKDAGVPVAISSDAHLAAHLANLRFGVWVARRGWLEKGDVLNTLPLAGLLDRLSRRPAARRSTPHMGGARLARFPRSPRSLT